MIFILNELSAVRSPNNRFQLIWSPVISDSQLCDEIRGNGNQITFQKWEHNTIFLAYIFNY